MPRINRIRIVNFSYNNDSRHILDETFNFHGGENALLSLANGGGKSVLVQLMLQPVVPGAKIQGRSISAFFKKKKLPSFMMIEWKLDGAGGYLLTGIAVVSTEAQGSDGEEKGRIRYFTFTSKYTHANAFDIAKIDFVSKNGGILEVKPFREAMSMMSEKARRDPYAFGFFSQEDMGEYARHLSEFGISQDEWRNIVSSINDSEGGLEEIFLKCRTSDQLLNEWMIRKTVEKVMFRDKGEARRLEDMMDNLVQEIVDNEQFILEKQLLDEFLSKFRQHAGDVNELLSGLDGQRKQAGTLLAMHAHLSTEGAALREKHGENEEELKTCEEEKFCIRLEERSHDYVLRDSEHKSALKKLRDAEASKRDKENELENVKLEMKTMDAARISLELSGIKSQLAGIEEGLAASKEQFDTDGRINSLEYSLKVRYEELLEKLSEDLKRLNMAQYDLKDRKIKAKEKSDGLDRMRSELDGEKGTLEERKRAFEKYQKELEQRLNIIIRRNLLGEIDQKEVQKTRNGLETTEKKLLQEIQRLEGEKNACIIRLKEIEKELAGLRKEHEDEKSVLQDLRRDIKEYEDREKEIKDVLTKNGLDFESRFDRERITSDFERIVHGLEERKQDAGRAREQASNSVHALKNGRLHVPDEFAVLLAKQDIQYETGEAYLRGQPIEIREKLLSSNHILPYSFVMTRQDIRKVASLALGAVLRQIVPLIAYEDLGMIIESEGSLAKLHNGLTLACLYEGRMFDADSLERLISELEKEQEDAAEQYRHFDDALKLARLDQGIVERFKFHHNYGYGLETGRKCSEDKLKGIDNSVSAIENEKSGLEVKSEKINQELTNASGDHKKSEEAIQTFQSLISQNVAYQAELARLSQVKTSIGEVGSQKVELEKSIDRLHGEIQQIDQQLRDTQNKTNNIQTRYALVKDVKVAALEEGLPEELEERLNMLKNQHQSSIEMLGKRRGELVGERSQKEKALKKLNLLEEQYADVVYDEADYDQFGSKIEKLEKLLKEKRDEELKTRTKEGETRSSLEHALSEVKKLGVEFPLGPEEIKGDFEGRFKRVSKRIIKLSDDNKVIQGTIYRDEKISENIARLVDTSEATVQKSFVLEGDVENQFRKLQKAFSEHENKNKGQAAKLGSDYFMLKTGYKEKNQNIENIFKGLDSLWEKVGTGFDGYYYLYERMEQQADTLSSLIRVCEIQLANLECSKTDMAQQSFMHGMRVYEEIQKIADGSTVKIQGRSRPVQMLRVDMQFDNKDAGLQRMKEYIESCIGTIRNETRQDKRKDEVLKTIGRLMASRELLNTFLGTQRIPVSVFKIDLNAQNSRQKAWEDAIRENSGGEKFVVFFSVLAALMAYTRANTMEAAGGDPELDTRVLVMDNPFGPISSEHLLKPMFEIARKYRTQLICLSDLKQSSIMNCFNLIYMVKIRTSAVGNNEYLKFEEYIRDQDAVENDEQLEKAVFRASDVKQVSLFDGM